MFIDLTDNMSKSVIGDNRSYKYTKYSELTNY